MARNGELTFICFALMVMSQFPVYGSGRHGPMRWYPLWELFADLNRSYGAGSVEIVYGSTILLFCGIFLIRKIVKNRR
jgi:hypothetical protein